MEPIITAIRLYLRRGWRSITGFFERNRLQAMPPVPTVIAVLVFGLAIPMSMRVDSRPTALSSALARLRLEEFLATGVKNAPTISPRGEIVSDRPAFLWTAVPDAGRYRFRLYDGDALFIGTDLVEAPCYLLPAPGRLAPGRVYRFTAEAVDAKGRGFGREIAATFSVRAPTAELRDLQNRVRTQLDPGDAAFVLAGYYAEKGWVHDLIAELERCRAAGLGGADGALARRVLAHHGHH